MSPFEKSKEWILIGLFYVVLAQFIIAFTTHAQSAYTQKPFPSRRQWKNFTQVELDVPLTLDKNGEGFIQYRTDLHPHLPATWVKDPIPEGIATGDPQWVGHWECQKEAQLVGDSDPPGWGRKRVPICEANALDWVKVPIACYPDENTRDKTVRFFPIDRDDFHLHFGTEPKQPGMKVKYHCSLA